MAANNTISKKGTFGTTMGVTSIIAILVVLVLIVFSALSITTAKADLTLSEKTASATSDFYKADSVAEERVAEADAEVQAGAGWQDRLREAGYTVRAGDSGDVIAYEVEINDKKALKVELSVSADGRVDRTLWQVIPTGDWEPDTDIGQLIIE
ncbi:MAG: hypothetical protein LBL63_04890 [Clostridiales Family XIII bacterium]|jgi:hypothetical protein|nr:hypothetical protein [Clostridiales Family XIII bacterium]